MKHKGLIASFLSILILLSIVCATARAQSQAFEPSVENMRLARLSGLARVWGAVKYFHPYLAYKDIDWDKALIDTIPKVNAARTGEEYRAAISQMPSVLNDPFGVGQHCAADNRWQKQDQDPAHGFYL